MPKFDHIGIYVIDLEESVQFYQELFGFPVGKQMKDGDIDMIFMDMNGAMLQLKQRPNPPSPGGEKYTHFAIYHEDYPGVLKKLDGMGVNYWEINLGRGKHSANFQDPSGHDVEVMEAPFNI